MIAKMGRDPTSGRGCTSTSALILPEGRWWPHGQHRDLDLLKMIIQWDGASSPKSDARAESARCPKDFAPPMCERRARDGVGRPTEISFPSTVSGTRTVLPSYSFDTRTARTASLTSRSGRQSGEFAVQSLDSGKSSWDGEPSAMACVDTIFGARSRPSRRDGFGSGAGGSNEQRVGTGRVRAG